MLGLWHQGVVGAACLADMGHDVIGIDADAGRLAKLGRGEAPLFEPGLDALIAKSIASGRLSLTADYAAVRSADFVFIMFDTPVDENDESDTSGIFRAVEQVAPELPPDAVVFVTAQVPVGTCDALAAIIRKATKAGSAAVAYMPENLRLGQAIERFMAPALPVIGCDESTTFDRLMQVLGPLAPKWHQVSLRTGEMMKHALNGFLAISVCFANELGNICDAVGADGKRLGELLRLEPRVGARAMLLPGLGFAGGTLARDMQTLRHLGDRFALDTPLLDGAWQSNVQQNRIVLRKLAQALPQLAGARIAILGLTYKADTSTLRRSAAMELIVQLIDAGASVSAHDPRADRDELKSQRGFAFFEDPMDALTGADALVLMTPWNEYRELDPDRARRRMSSPYVLDTAGLWSADRWAEAGFSYDDIGRGRLAANN